MRAYLRTFTCVSTPSAARNSTTVMTPTINGCLLLPLIDSVAPLHQSYWISSANERLSSRLMDDRLENEVCAPYSVRTCHASIRQSSRTRSASDTKSLSITSSARQLLLTPTVAHSHPASVAHCIPSPPGPRKGRKHDGVALNCLSLTISRKGCLPREGIWGQEYCVQRYGVRIQ